MVQIIDDIDHLRPGLRFVATVGVFDGVHLGHGHVLECLRDLAAELRAASVAITFEPHPQAVITGRAPDLICDPQDRLARIAEAGADVIVVQRFDEAFRSQSAEEFLERLGRGRDLAGLVMSHESAFGRDRQGTVDTVRRLAARDGFRLVEVDTLEVDGAPVSSSRVRAAVASGDLEAAERLLGRGYAVAGTVECDASGRWVLIPDGSVVLPPLGAYQVVVSGRGSAEAPARADGAGTAFVREAGTIELGTGLDPRDARAGSVRLRFRAGMT
jgi:riboflavin kinase/FMN adenylyltransferase